MGLGTAEVEEQENRSEMATTGSLEGKERDATMGKDAAVRRR